MRQRFTIILTFVVIIGLLVILNAASHLKREKIADLELLPNRSTYHNGPTGLRALHDFLSESGYKVIRWREAPKKLRDESGKLVTTFVVVGETQIPFSEADKNSLRDWVAEGGRLVLIDRKLEALAPELSRGKFRGNVLEVPSTEVDPANSSQMTEHVTALHPVQPTVLTNSVQTVMPSRYASRLRVSFPEKTDESEDKAPPVKPTFGYGPRKPETKNPPPSLPNVSPAAPVVHIADSSGGALLIDYAYGAGKIVILSDPYIISNGGIKLNDNLQLAINTITARDGVIAFDEYHQGRGVTENAFAAYFAGTPVLALAGQVGLLVLLLLWTNARRFGRPLPLPQVDRRSSLEFVASMAELQERSRAFDLAIENIYTRTRRVLARMAGLDYNSSRTEIAARVAERSSIDERKLETLMRQCEEAINGTPISARQSIELVKRLRDVERRLGLLTRQRDERQSSRKNLTAEL